MGILYDDKTVTKKVPVKHILHLDEEDIIGSPHWSTLVADDANDDFCNVCKKGGILICCDHCCRSYHKECNEELSSFIEDIPDDFDFICPQCKEKDSSQKNNPSEFETIVKGRLSCDRCRLLRKGCIYYSESGPCE